MKNTILDLSFISAMSLSSVGMQPPRAYYIPFSDKDEGKDAFSPRGESSEFFSLDGVWQFKKYDAPELTGDFLNEEYEAEIPVPSCVQYFGCDEPQYSGGRTTFPFRPPFVPRENPVYCYRRTFGYEKTKGKKQYMVFEGADSCLWLYVNGGFVGYAEISHADHEFDVTDFLKDGRNTVDVAVAKFCKGSYLELQDKWRFSGLFRSVYLLTRPERHVEDYKISSICEGGNWSVLFEYLRGASELSVEIEGIRKTLKAGESAGFPLVNARLWTAETPELYPVVLESNGEKIYEAFAVRKIEIKDRVVMLNGSPIKFRGANRHDFSASAGATVTDEEMLEDIRILKNFNFNAVRTSHYPNYPEFYKLCDRYGVYVISEADIECHGAVLIEGGYEEDFFNLISDNPEWQKLYLDRIEALYEREKNRGCILLWSLGNESGYGRNHETAAELLHAKDTRLVHYEGIQCRRDHKTNINDDIYYTPLLDVVSRMYPSVEYMRENCLNDEREHRPLLLCEYAHSMGNGPGGLTDYWALMDNEPFCAGAFVWEWADHGIDTGDGKYRYGDDFEAEFSDHNFCIDGAFGPGREIKSSSLSLKYAMQPIRTQKTGEHTYAFTNGYDFLSTDGLKVVAVFRKNGLTVEEREVPLSLPPHGTEEIDLPFPCALEAGDYANVIFLTRTKEKASLTEKGHLTAMTGFTVQERGRKTETFVSEAVFEKPAPNVSVVRSGNAVYTFDSFKGILNTVNLNGRELIVGLQPQIKRALLDNDKAIYEGQWEKFALYKSKPTAYREYFDAETQTLIFEGGFTCQGYRPMVEYTLTYKFRGSSTELTLEGKVFKSVEYLPRFGIRLFLPEDYKRYVYLGFGGSESYIDKKNMCVKDVFEADVIEDYVRYIKPQESTSHCGTDEVKLCGAEGTVKASADREFSFSAVPYTAEEIMNARHDFELGENKKTVLSLDFRMSGVGSESCGPHLDKKYQCSERNPKITFRLDF